jgi:hypothetical protein
MNRAAILGTCLVLFQVTPAFAEDCSQGQTQKAQMECLTGLVQTLEKRIEALALHLRQAENAFRRASDGRENFDGRAGASPNAAGSD